MRTEFAVLGVLAAGFFGFVLGRRKDDPSAADVADASFFLTTPGSGNDDFCAGKILKKRLKGRVFHWARKGMGCEPASGSRFEIRLKPTVPPRPNPLIPPVPSGVNHILADVQPWASAGVVYYYSLYQVLADGTEKQLHDPELEIGN
ncbi:MAG TPA: hypothetical protein VNJ02_15960 [Vicinamibacterales bacterium]|nr:hypothetical protein [Vicinamibacterales bacterium]